MTTQILGQRFQIGRHLVPNHAGRQPVKWRVFQRIEQMQRQCYRNAIEWMRRLKSITQFVACIANTQRFRKLRFGDIHRSVPHQILAREKQLTWIYLLSRYAPCLKRRAVVYFWRDQFIKKSE